SLSPSRLVGPSLINRPPCQKRVNRVLFVALAGKPCLCLQPLDSAVHEAYVVLSIVPVSNGFVVLNHIDWGSMCKDRLRSSGTIVVTKQRSLFGVDFGEIESFGPVIP